MFEKKEKFYPSRQEELQQLSQGVRWIIWVSAKISSK
jgi:hypothetical protein